MRVPAEQHRAIDPFGRRADGGFVGQPKLLFLDPIVEPRRRVAFRSAVAEVAPDQPIYSVQTMNERLGNWFAPRRFSATILGMFTAIAMILSAIGIYGIISYFVTQRTQEFGIRMALGATTRDVLKLVLRQAAMLTVGGIVGGVLVSLAVNRLLASLLLGVKAADPLAGSIAVMILALVAFSASYLPARRATKVDPIVALRYE